MPDVASKPRYPHSMQVRLDIPDELSGRIADTAEELSRAALEALALEGYRSERLSESDICALLGFETRMQVHEFFKANGHYLHYSLDDLEYDRQTAERLRARRRTRLNDEERLAG